MGKWRFLLPQLDRYVRENKFLGYTNGMERARMGIVTQASPEKFTSLYSSLQLGALTPQTLPIIQAQIQHERIESIEEVWERFDNRPNFIVVDSLHSFMPSGKINEFGDVRDFLLRLRRWCEAKNITILATVPTAKQKMGQGYERPLERILGASNWPVDSGTALVIDYPKGETDELTPMRRILLALHSEQWRETFWEFDALGRMQQSISPLAWRERLDDKLYAMPIDQPFRTSEMVCWAEQFGVPPSSLKLWISEKRRDGELTQVRKGMYKRPRMC